MNLDTILDSFKFEYGLRGWQQAGCFKERYWKTCIKPYLDARVKNITKIYGFDEKFNKDCVDWLKGQLDKFDLSKGNRPQGYFSVCAKHYLIVKNKRKRE